jgi:type IV secretory pathway TrbL component
MAEPLSADTPQLIAEAANFDRIAGELKAILGYVNGTAATLATQLDSEAAGAAAQAALVRFEEASTSQIQLQHPPGWCGLRHVRHAQRRGAQLADADLTLITYRTEF